LDFGVFLFYFSWLQQLPLEFKEVSSTVLFYFFLSVNPIFIHAPYLCLNHN